MSKPPPVQTVKDKMICVVVVTFWLFYPEICQYAFSSFNCLYVDANTGYRLYDDLGAECWDAQHSALFGAISMPCVLGLVICAPIWLLLKMKGERAVVDYAVH